MLTTTLHKANTRGFADHGWLKSYHTFSFADYFDENRVHFGALRVLNDDYVAGGMGFGQHPHRDMEIISIPLEGDLEHQDSMGNKEIIRHSDVQVMSAGTGVMHSEYNKNSDKAVKFLQIWVIPNQQGVTPRYDQITLNPADRKNTFQQIVSPNANDAGAWIHQNAWFNLADFDAGFEKKYTINQTSNGLYIFVLSGSVTVADQVLETRDGLGIENFTTLNIKALENSSFLLMEVPMLK
ncbi:pirin family protein [Flavobacterium agricola]|uniref:Pirin family protein n=1 Tax=Flavobacterium agricola TaxID=2870839 RepID=A0ABY6LWK3_9FLAO|nr:pirin family protein [Flavobacterium agricola]UYW00710.1 pirin family protein [Flavobacterium agricola]